MRVPHVRPVELALRSLELSWSGVDLFFVLSGFLIGGILLDAKDSPNYYRTFYLRRFHRILPLYAVWMGIFVLSVAVVDFTGARQFSHVFNDSIPLWSFPVFVQNFLQTARHTFGSDWMDVTWSLAVEEQFYLLLPLLIRVFDRRRLVLLTAVAIAMAPAWRLLLQALGNPVQGPYTLLPCRADALGMGVLIAVTMRTDWLWSKLTARRHYLYGALAILLGGVVLLLRWPARTVLNGPGFTWLAATYACILLLTLINPGPPGESSFPPFLSLHFGSYGLWALSFSSRLSGACPCNRFRDTSGDQGLENSGGVFRGPGFHPGHRSAVLAIF